MNSSIVIFPIAIRPAVENDLPFIYNSWLLTCKDALPESMIPSKIYFLNKAKEIEKILNISNTIIACLQGEHDIICGYMSFIPQEDLIVNMIYVKTSYRKMNVANQLIKQADPLYKDKLIVATQISKSLLAIKKKYKNVVYNPYVINNLIEAQ